MQELGAMALAWGVGFLSGLVSAVPVGPINVTIINEAAQRGFRWALMIGLGAGAMEMVYCAIGFAGFAELFQARYVQATFQLVGCLVIAYLGWHYYTAQTVPAVTRTEREVERRFHPHTAFMIGFLRVLGNPGVLLFWLAVAATFSAHRWVQPTLSSKAACLAGVAVATFGWFVLLAWVAARAHGRFTVQGLRKLSKLSGFLLLIVAGVMAARIIRTLAAH